MVQTKLTDREASFSLKEGFRGRLQPFGARKTLDFWESFSSSVKYIFFVTCLRGLASKKCHFFSSQNVNVHSRWYRHKPQFLLSPHCRFLNMEWESFWEMDFLLNTDTSVLSEMKGAFDSLNLFLYQFPIFSNVNLFQTSKFSPVFGSDPS